MLFSRIFKILVFFDNIW